jgi:hypothetical protein
MGGRGDYLNILQFDTNYIIFRNVEILENYFLQIKKYIVKEK